MHIVSAVPTIVSCPFEPAMITTTTEISRGAIPIVGANFMFVANMTPAALARQPDTTAVTAMIGFTFTPNDCANALSSAIARTINPYVVVFSRNAAMQSNRDANAIDSHSISVNRMPAIMNVPSRIGHTIRFVSSPQNNDMLL